jgi:host factor-I protein
MIFAMEGVMEEQQHGIEPQFLSYALATGASLRISLMNKMEYQGVLSDVGRYEINIEVNGTVLTLLKQEITSLSSLQPLITPSEHQTQPEPSASATDTVHARPNIQQEFLDKAIKEHQVLTLYLLNGQRLKAHLDAYDNFTLLLSEGGRQYLFYKHSITTINR